MVNIVHCQGMHRRPEDGVQALTMRSLAGRLGVVPGAVYRHIRNKQQLQDLLLDGVLAEITSTSTPR
jgi:AcrR family transcriptional regulator